MLRIEEADGIRCIGLDRAAKRNAISVELTLALEDALLQARHDASVHTLVFHGVGDHFSAGMDLKDFFDSSTRPPDVMRRARVATEHWRTRLLWELPQTMICAVRGYCLGGAMPFLAASQVVFASPDARFGLPEINFGFVPGAQIVKAAGRMIAPRGLAYAALTGRLFDVERARRWGLVTEVTDDPLARALELARTMSAQRGRSFPLPTQTMY
ncbi:enoyl-CoA hydratase/isomerase family protein [Verticiella sediminum]|uniref:Enoyl-CoA hydratase/isomerase family protein n=1 Tax=Verticiella sediminum TaxID=1247510 RepID=A0A556ABD5_9BURK|nr:enoyl-CoA hydratase/isomerase family protein [Verticiella sediminum]TSH90181.1 enoyl-CoA hydratase/isomerase family protein [Verticiella sediminum]